MKIIFILFFGLILVSSCDNEKLINAEPSNHFLIEMAEKQMNNKGKVEKLEIIEKRKKLDFDNQSTLRTYIYKCQIKFTGEVLLGKAYYTTADIKSGDVYEIEFFGDFKKVEGDWYCLQFNYDLVDFKIIKKGDG